MAFRNLLRRRAERAPAAEFFDSKARSGARQNIKMGTLPKFTQLPMEFSDPNGNAERV
jgi:hypothetical protein